MGTSQTPISIGGIMRAAKTFFYVSLGILALAGAFHLGAQTAQGQAGNRVVVGGIAGLGAYDPAAFGVDPSGNIWAKDATSTPLNEGTGPIAPPKAGTIAAVEGSTNNNPLNTTISVLYEDGDIFYYTSTGSIFMWRFVGNLFSGAPVQATETTWGRIKAERR